MVILEAPCKLNLRLKILGRRPDGYHLLESLFYPVKNVADIIEIRPASQFSVSYFENSSPLKFENDLVSKAWHAFIASFEIKRLYHISVKKIIPWGAGLGGGSSDAAAVLKYLAGDNGVSLSDPEFLNVCTKVGSDVPFFIQNKSAWVTGIGETVSPIDLDSFHVVIVKPSFGVSTVDAYNWFDADLNLQAGSMISDFKSHVLTGPKVSNTKLFSFCENDLQAAVTKRHPEIQTLIQSLLDFGSDTALMSGSGSAAFGLYRSQHSAEETYERLKSRKADHGYSVFLG